MIGLFKTEVICRQDSWRGLDEVEIDTLQWVWWFDHHRLLESIGYIPIGYIPPVVYEQAYYSRHENQTLKAVLT